MSVCRLIETLSTVDKLPVHVDQVVSALRNLGVVDEIRYARDVDLASGIMMGFLRQEETRGSGKKRRISTVTYAKLGHEMERVVATKELIHVADPPGSRTSTQSGLSHLISKMALPHMFRSQDNSEDVETDHYALLEAVALLFPLRCRDILYHKYMEKKLTLAWIADKAELPVDFVKPVMNGLWPQTVTSLMERRRRIEAAKAPSRKPRKSRITTT